MNRMRTAAVAAAVAAILTAPTLGGIIITQGTSAPTYATTLNFDEPGGPTGFVAPDAWSISHGITELQAGDLSPQVGDFTTNFGPWVGTGNSFFGNFGVFITWANDLTEFSTQLWDPSGPPGPFGGGLSVFVFNNGTQVASGSFEPAWGGIGNSWFDVTTNTGSTFNEVRLLGFGFDPTTFVDDLSWNVVPEPGSLLLFSGVIGFTLLRRRR
ncbi:MAG: PEP-CTERM sorting domain-containing protein [Phycisphaerae bacterium]